MVYSNGGSNRFTPIPPNLTETISYAILWGSTVFNREIWAFNGNPILPDPNFNTTLETNGLNFQIRFTLNNT
jgi:hypothetical protein